jgi:5-formyltetrahydrofolate cyclo-ligase
MTGRDAMRARLRAQRSALTPAARIAAAAGVAAMLETLPEFLVDPCIAGYWSVDGEVPLNLAQSRLVARGQRYCLPLLQAGRRLRFAPWQTGDALAPNRYGIPEPAAPGEMLEPRQLDVVLVPLLGFDRHGHRLGSGGGYYDRSFAFLGGATRPTRPLLVGIAYAFQELAPIATHEHDIALDFVATENELIDCTQAGRDS